jgi:hypothetical protein
MILAVAVFAERLASIALEIDAGRIEENHAQIAEKIAPRIKKLLLYQIFHAARSELHRPFLVFNRVSKKPHRPVEMLESETIGGGNLEIIIPFQRRPVAARLEYPMHDRAVDCSFNVKFEVPLQRASPDNVAEPEIIPQSSKNLVGAYAPARDRLAFTRLMF